MSQLRCAIYARYSTVKQNPLSTLASPNHRLVQLAPKGGLELPPELEDSLSQAAVSTSLLNLSWKVLRYHPTEPEDDYFQE